MICLILIFNHIINKVVSNIKNIIYIKKEISFNFLILVYVKIHNYDQDNNLYNNEAENTKVFLLSLYISKSYSFTFIQSFCNTNNIFCQLFSALLIY